jgi:chromosome partitioning protein
MRMVQSALEKISVRLGCRVAEGIAERVIFRSLFPTGMTVFDPLDEETMGGLPSTSHLSARQEYKALAEALQLPVSERAAARRAALSVWEKTAGQPPRFEHMAASGTPARLPAGV